MTDNEIIKALECCNGYDCETCRALKYCDYMHPGALARASLDLINRQKAEIEMLKELITYQKQEIKEKEQKYNQAVDDMFGLIETTRNEIAEAKSEAIKEFAEELEYFVLNEDIEVAEPKCKDYESYINGANQFRHQIKNGINNLVKEMTEE